MSEGFPGQRRLSGVPAANLYIDSWCACAVFRGKGDRGLPAFRECRSPVKQYRPLLCITTRPAPATGCSKSASI